IAETHTRSGMIRSTCLMEPGDSGGPVFDLEGRVIGIHSRINVVLEDNFEIPVDQFHRYWSALNTARSYSRNELPEEDKIYAPPGETPQTFETLGNLGGYFSDLESRLDKTSLLVTSRLGADTVTALGTLFSLEDLVPAKVDRK